LSGLTDHCNENCNWAAPSGVPATSEAGTMDALNTAINCVLLVLTVVVDRASHR
jgi:hypothetical protein